MGDRVVTSTQHLELDTTQSDVDFYTLADLLINYFIQLQVEYVFGIPGGAIEPFYNALADGVKRGGPRAITARHESACAFMADGYHCQTGKLGVVCSTTGPGATNLLTGVSSAYTNHVPMLVITAQTPLNTFGRRAFQESSCTGINTLAMFEPCTLYNSLVSHADQLELKLATAIMTAFGNNPGPVHLSIPMDVLNTPIEKSNNKFQLPRLILDTRTIDENTIEKLAHKLLGAQRTVFVIGEGCGPAMTEILESVRLLDADIVTTPLGKGLVNPYCSVYKGVVGFAGHVSANEALANPEVEAVICIGTALSEWSSNNWDTDLLLNDRLIHIDQRDKNFLLTPMAALQVRVNINYCFANLTRYLASHPHLTNQNNPAKLSKTLPFALDDFNSFSSKSSPIHPARLMAELPDIFPFNTRYLADIGCSFAWALHYLHPKDRREKGVRDRNSGLFRTCVEFSAMGWAIGCAIGTALALPGQVVVCIVGDGSLLMNGQEITVAVQENLPVIYVVLNDSSLGMVKHGQRLTGAASIGHDIPVTDFVGLANALGAEGFRIESPQDLQPLKNINYKELKRPLLLDVLIDKNAVPPIGKRTSTLKKT